MKIVQRKAERDSIDNQKLFFRDLKTLKSNKKMASVTITNETREILFKGAENIERWKDYS